MRFETKEHSRNLSLPRRHHENYGSRFALGAAKEQEINVVLKKAGDANKLTCLIARQSPSALLNISALWLA